MPHGAPGDLASQLEPDYEVVGELGRGGSSIVYLGRDRLLGRRVAIKVIRDSRLEDREAIARFEREAQMLARLQHPNIVTLFAARRLSGGSLVLVMQNGDWRTLKEVIREDGSLSFARAEQVLRDIGNALVYLHRHDVIHRDVKPENIFLDRESGRALLSDFGIARFGDGHSSVTLAGSVLGTPAYMAPEQIDSAEQTYQSDIYSLGMVGYEMLTGMRPWHGEGLYSVIFKQKTERLPPLEDRRPGVPIHLLSAVERAIEKDPALRWPTAERFVGQLGLGLPETPKDEPSMEPALPPAAYEEEDGATVVFTRPPAPDAVPAGREAPGSWRLAGAAVVLMLCLGGAAAVVASMTSGARAPGPVAARARMDPSPADRSRLPEGSRTTPPAAETPSARNPSPEAQLRPVESPALEPIVEPAPAPPSGLRAGSRPRVAPRGVVPASREPVGEPIIRPGPSLIGEPITERPRTLDGSPDAGGATPPSAPSPSEGRAPEAGGDAPLVPPALRNASDLTRVLRALPATELRRTQGRVVVIAILVNEAGRVEDSRIKTASGAPQLDNALLEAVKVLRFTPASRLGKEESTWVDLPITLGGGT